MAFPLTSALDDFNTGALQNLTSRAGWSATMVRSGKVTCTTDAAPTYATCSTTNGSNVYGTTFSANQESWAVLDVLGSDFNIYCRLATNGTTTSAGYVLQVTSALTWKIFNHNFVGQLGSTGTQAVSAGDSIGLECIGTAITAYYRSGAGAWQQVVTTTSSNSLSSGLIAFDATDSTTLHLGTFGGGGTSSGVKSFALVGVGA